MTRKTDQPPLRWRIATGLRRDTRATVFWWRWLVPLPFFIFLTLSSHVSVCWCAVLGTPLLASPLPSGDLQCGESARFFFQLRWTLLTLHRTLEFVDPRERAQSPVPLCAPSGFQAHGHACARAVLGCVRASKKNEILQTFTASCAEASCASVRACVRWRTPPVVRRQRRDQSPVLKTGQVVEATVPSFPQRSCQSLARAHGTDASVFRACARRTHIDRFSICFSGQVNAVKTGHLGLAPYLQVGQCNGSVFRTRLVLCVSCVWTNFPKCHTAESNWER